MERRGCKPSSKSYCLLTIEPAAMLPEPDGRSASMSMLPRTTFPLELYVNSRYTSLPFGILRMKSNCSCPLNTGKRISRLSSRIQKQMIFKHLPHIFTSSVPWYLPYFSMAPKASNGNLSRPSILPEYTAAPLPTMRFLGNVLTVSFI